LKQAEPVQTAGTRKERKDYAFRRQLIEKPSIIRGCPGEPVQTAALGNSSAALLILSHGSGKVLPVPLGLQQ